MRENLVRGAAAAGAVLVGAAIVYYLREKATPGPDYRVLMSDGEFELRAYPAVTVAETVVSGPRKDALNEGYRILADYLTAQSRSGEALAMRVPVLQDGGDPMASDPPVFDDDLGETGAWRVRFVMPAEEEALPAPPEGVTLVDLPARRVGAARFSGTADDSKLAAYGDRLRGWLGRQGEPNGAEPEFAFYNSPMIPPLLRRNEVLIPLG